MRSPIRQLSASPFVNSFKISGTGGQCRTACNGLVVWSYANVLQQTGSPGPVITGKVITTPSNCIIPGSGDEAGVDNFIDTGATRSGRLQYASGYIFSNLNTGNGGISAVLAWNTQPFLDDNGDDHCTGALMRVRPSTVEYSCARLTNHALWW